MFGNHLWDLLPLIILALLFFGPKKLPEIGSSVGKTIKEFQKSMREVNTHEEPATPALPASQAQQLPAASAPTTTATTTSASTPAEMVSEVKAE